MHSKTCARTRSEAMVNRADFEVDRLKTAEGLFDLARRL
jgi:hypothetical protein